MTKAVVEYPANLSIISVISEAIFQHTSRWEFVWGSQVSLSSDRARFWQMTRVDYCQYQRLKLNIFFS